MPRAYLVFLLFCFALPAFAQQQVPRAEVFGGYSFLHIDTQGIAGSTLDAACNNILGTGTCPAGTFQVHGNFNGWNAALQVNATRVLGFEADFSGHYGMPVTLSSQAQSLLLQFGITGFPPNVRSYSYLFGPVMFAKSGKFKPFAHALFGANNVGTNLSGIGVSGLAIPGITLSDTAFAMAFGGGVDVRLSEHLSLRAGQGDYLYTKHDFSGGIQGIATHQNNFRLSVGIVFQLGQSAMSAAPPASRNVAAAGTIVIPELGVYAAAPENLTGARITVVTPNGAAGLAGIHVGDIIDNLNGTQVNTPSGLANVLSSVQPGTKVRIGYMIGGRWQTETTVIVGNH